MPIRIVCAQCGVKLDAPDTLAGKKGKCPKCGTIFRIPVPDAPAVPMEQPAADKKNESSTIVVSDLPSLNSTAGNPKRLEWNNLYVVLGSDRIVAYLKQGEGWQLNVGKGFVSARQENQMIPEQGEFVLLEGNVHETENGRRLVGIQFFKINGRADLMAISRSDGEILEKITGRTTLLLTQKRQFLTFLRDHYFPAFTDDAPEIVDFLLGEDFHSEQIGDCACENTDGLPHEGTGI